MASGPPSFNKSASPPAPSQPARSPAPTLRPSPEDVTVASGARPVFRPPVAANNTTQIAVEAPVPRGLLQSVPPNVSTRQAPHLPAQIEEYAADAPIGVAENAPAHDTVADDSAVPDAPGDAGKAEGVTAPVLPPALPAPTSLLNIRSAKDVLDPSALDATPISDQVSPPSTDLGTAAPELASVSTTNLSVPEPVGPAAFSSRRDMTPPVSIDCADRVVPRIDSREAGTCKVEHQLLGPTRAVDLAREELEHAQTADPMPGAAPLTGAITAVAGTVPVTSGMGATVEGMQDGGSRRKWLLIGAAVLACVGAGGAIWVTQRTPSPAAVPRGSPTPGAPVTGPTSTPASPMTPPTTAPAASGTAPTPALAPPSMPAAAPTPPDVEAAPQSAIVTPGSIPASAPIPAARVPAAHVPRAVHATPIVSATQPARSRKPPAEHNESAHEHAKLDELNRMLDEKLK